MLISLLSSPVHIISRQIVAHRNNVSDGKIRIGVPENCFVDCYDTTINLFRSPLLKYPSINHNSSLNLEKFKNALSIPASCRCPSDL